MKAKINSLLKKLGCLTTVALLLSMLSFGIYHLDRVLPLRFVPIDQFIIAEDLPEPGYESIAMGIPKSIANGRVEVFPLLGLRTPDGDLGPSALLRFIAVAEEGTYLSCLGWEGTFDLRRSHNGLRLASSDNRTYILPVDFVLRDLEQLPWHGVIIEFGLYIHNTDLNANAMDVAEFDYIVRVPRSILRSVLVGDR
jgi:hypothetical protein